MKRRYRATFREVTTYVVEFDSPVAIDKDGNTLPYDDNNTEHDWFTTMDEADPDWPMKADQIDVEERDLLEIKRVGRA